MTWQVAVISSVKGSVTIVADGPFVAMLARLRKRKHPFFTPDIKMQDVTYQITHSCYCRAEAEDIVAGKHSGEQYAVDRELLDVPGTLICMTTGQSFPSISAASRALGIDRGLIKRAITAPDGFAPTVNMHFFQVKRTQHGPSRD